MPRRYLAALAISLAVTVTVVVVAVAGGGSAAPASPVAPSPPSTSTGPRPAALEGLSSSASEPQRAAVTAALAVRSRPAAIGGHLAGTVIDADTGDVLWSRSASVAEPPASTTKLLTATAALTTLGPGFRFVTATRRVGHVIYLVGGGDPTILRSANSPAVPPYPQPATLAGLARATAAALPTSGRFELRTDTAAWGAAGLAPGWSPDYLTEGDVTVPSALELDEGRLDPTDPDSPRTATPVAQAGAAFAALLTRSGVHLRGAVTTASAPSSARAVAQVQSPPLAELVQRMLTVSDNDLAEALGRAVAVHDGMLATFAGAAAAVRRSVAALGVEPALVSLDDASGLSHADRVAPRALVTVLRAADSTTRPELRSIIDGLPVAGFTGTLADRYRTKATSPSAGIVRAKTGSLTAVNALAGQVVDASGRLLIFALLVSASPSPQPTIDALDRLVSTLAGCGCSDAAG